MTEPFTPKAGMRCVMRNGEEVGPLESYVEEVDSSFIFMDSKIQELWRADGTWSIFFTASDFDLIAEAKPEEGAEEPLSYSDLRTFHESDAACIRELQAINARLYKESDSSASAIARLEAENAGLMRHVESLRAHNSH